MNNYLAATPAKKSKGTLAKGFKAPVQSVSHPVREKSPKPSTSGTSKSGGSIDLNTPPQLEDVDDDEFDDNDDEKCCICNKFQPSELENCQSFVFVKWAKCDLCDHWKHLIYCSDVGVVRRDVFKCPHCTHTTVSLNVYVICWSLNIYVMSETYY